jgi:hypothetical protein
MARTRAAVPAMILAGTIIRLVVAFATHGLPYDVQSWSILRTAFSQHPLHVYALVNQGGNFHWPYPPGFFPLMLVASGAADLFGGFSHLIRIPSVLADAALTWLVWYGLAGRVSERARLAGAALVAFGPVFITISGYAAQIDSVAILPAVAALLVWERAPTGQRAWIAGLLIGLAAAIKTVPLVMVLALAPTARDRRELVLLLACSIAVPLAAFAPFYLADASGVRNIANYVGSPGMGGLSLVLQPNLAARWLSYWVNASGIEQSLFIDHAGLFNVVILAAYALYAWRVRPRPRLAAALLWLMVIAFGSGFFFQYLVWGLPFFLLAGHLRATAFLQVLITAPMLIYYAGPWKAHSIVWAYVPLMLAVWACWTCGAAVLARKGASERIEAAT